MAIVKDWKIGVSKEEGNRYRVIIAERWTDDVKETVTYGRSYSEVFYKDEDTLANLKKKFKAKIDEDNAKLADEDLVKTDLEANLII